MKLSNTPRKYTKQSVILSNSEESQRDPSDSLRMTTPKIMAILNLTPDSFSDGGQYKSCDQVMARISQFVEEGADIIDIGAESSRPGSRYISADEEWQRLEKVLESLNKQNVPTPISLDTRKPEIMKRACNYGVRMINNIEGLTDEKTLSYLAEQHCSYIAMHMHKTPATMQNQPLDGNDAAALVDQFFQKAQNVLQGCGFKKEQIFVDPGIGFGKTDRASLMLMGDIKRWETSYNVAIGISRKSFIGRFLDIEKPWERDPPSKLLELGLMFLGARIIRTHDVKPLVKMRNLLG